MIDVIVALIGLELQDFQCFKSDRSGISTNGNAPKYLVIAFNKSAMQLISLYRRVISRVITNHVDTTLSTLDQKKKLICRSVNANTSFTNEQLFGFQADLGLSDRQMILIAQDLRVVTDLRKAVEHGFKQSLSKNSHTVDDYFR